MKILTWRWVSCELGVSRSVRNDFIPMVKSGQLLHSVVMAGQQVLVLRCLCGAGAAGAVAAGHWQLPASFLTALQLLALLEGTVLSRALWRASGAGPERLVPSTKL